MAEGAGFGPAHAGISSMTSAYKAGPFTNSGNPPEVGKPTCEPIRQPSKSYRVGSNVSSWPVLPVGRTERAATLLIIWGASLIPAKVFRFIYLFQSVTRDSVAAATTSNCTTSHTTYTSAGVFAKNESGTFTSTMSS